MREEFDLDPSFIYLNSGTHSIAPRAVLEAVTRHQREYERNPTQGLIAVWAKLWDVQKRLAAFFHAEPEDLFLRHNVSEAMAAFILGMPLREGGEILLSDLEYGAVENICRERAYKGNYELRRFHIPLNAEGLTKLVVDQLRDRTRLLVLSHVATGTGLLLPIARIAEETRKRGILLAVDGAHAAGALPLDFRDLQDVDFYGTNLHKWLLGPKGTGFGWVPKRHQEALRPLEPGWTTFETAPEFASFGGGSRFASRLLMPGCRDFAPFLALHETLDFWKRHGEGAIRARLDALMTELERVMDPLGWEPLSPPLGSLRGPLAAYALPERLEKEGPALMSRLLAERRLQVSITRPHGKCRLRLSPHVYNTEEELAQAAKALRDV